MQISKLAHTIPLFPKMARTPEKFWELADVNMKFLYNMAVRYTGNRYDAEDLVQETFYIGLKKFYQLREERKFKSWLFAVLRNTYLKKQRQEGKFLKSEYEDGTDYIRLLENAAEHIDLASAYEQKIESEQIQELIDELPEKQKTPLLLYYMSGMSYQEISDMLEVPMGTVMSRLSRGKQILKKKVLRHYMRTNETARVVQFPRQVKNR